MRIISIFPLVASIYCNIITPIHRFQEQEHAWKVTEITTALYVTKDSVSLLNLAILSVCLIPRPSMLDAGNKV